MQSALHAGSWCDLDHSCDFGSPAESGQCRESPSIPSFTQCILGLNRPRTDQAYRDPTTTDPEWYRLLLVHADQCSVHRPSTVHASVRERGNGGVDPGPSDSCVSTAGLAAGSLPASPRVQSWQPGSLAACPGQVATVVIIISRCPQEFAGYPFRGGLCSVLASPMGLGRCRRAVALSVDRR